MEKGELLKKSCRSSPFSFYTKMPSFMSLEIIENSKYYIMQELR